MALDLRYDVATTVSHIDPRGIVPTTATVTLRRPDGTDTGLAGVVAKPTVGAVVASSGSTKTAVVLVSTTGIVVGDTYRLVSHGVTYLVRVDRVDGSTVYLAAALDAAPAAGSTLSALRMQATIAAPGLAAIGPNYRLEWAYGSATEQGYHQDIAHVVRWLPDDPITGAGVRAIAATMAPSSVSQRSQVYYDDIARRARDKVWKAIEGTGRRPHLIGGTDVFAEAGRLAARLYLADDGLYPTGADPAAYAKDQHFRLEAELRTVISGLSTYDADGSGSLSEAEQQPALWSFPVQRGRSLRRR